MSVQEQPTTNDSASPKESETDLFSLSQDEKATEENTGNDKCQAQTAG
jgi:hypothetical protein